MTELLDKLDAMISDARDKGERKIVYEFEDCADEKIIKMIKKSYPHYHIIAKDEQRNRRPIYDNPYLTESYYITIITVRW